MPLAAASVAAILSAFSMAVRSQLEACANGMGKVVRKPWITSCPNNSGIFNLDCIAISCNSLVCCTPITLSMEPICPLRICACLSPSFVIGPVWLQSPLYWFICPIFSSSVISFSTESTFCEMDFCCACIPFPVKSSRQTRGRWILFILFILQAAGTMPGCGCVTHLYIFSYAQQLVFLYRITII